MKPGNCQQMARAGSIKGVSQFLADFGSIPDYQGFQDRSAIRIINGFYDTRQRPAHMFVIMQDSRSGGFRHELDMIVRHKGRDIDFPPRKIPFVIESTRIIEISWASNPAVNRDLITDIKG